MFSKIKNNWQLFAVLALSVLFFIGTAGFNFYTQNYIDENGSRGEFVKWASPDESANYVFTKLYAQEGQMSIEENYNLYTKDIMHPRSFRSDYGTLRPMSFLGIILIYGKIASVVGYKIIPYFTPLIAALGILYFYLLIKKLFNKSNAWISASLLAVFPPYIYYTARSMFHNVLFTVFLIIGLYYALKAVENRARQLKSKKAKIVFRARLKSFFKNYKDSRGNLIDFAFAALSGVAFGLAIITRASELLWLLPLLFALWLFNFKKIGISRLLVFLSFVFLALLPALHYNQVLYGSYFFGGYSEMNRSLVALAGTGAEVAASTVKGDFSLYKSAFNTTKEIVFHFGLHPRQSLNMALIYFVKMFAWLFWPALVGFLLFLWNFRKNKKGQWLFAGLLFLISSILILYYGSWEFYDNPDKTRHTIGNSYTRYWLPVYLGAMPFAAMFIMRFSRALSALINKIFRNKGKSREGNLNLFAYPIKRKFFQTAIRTTFLIVFSYVSLNFVLHGSEEGLLFLSQRQIKSRFEAQKVLELTESNSTIITFYHDKLFFPERKVIVGLFNDPNMIAEYANLVKLLPVYYYNFTFPEKDLAYLNDRRLAEAGLGIEPVRRISGDFTLYKIFERVAGEELQVEAVDSELVD